MVKNPPVNAEGAGSTSGLRHSACCGHLSPRALRPRSAAGEAAAGEAPHRTGQRPRPATQTQCGRRRGTRPVVAERPP